MKGPPPQLPKGQDVFISRKPNCLVVEPMVEPPYPQGSRFVVGEENVASCTED